MDIIMESPRGRRGAGLRLIAALGAATALAALGGCAAFNSVDSAVTSYSTWPDARKPSTYAFERLPSQQAMPQQAQVLEDAARVAVEGAGFVPVPAGAAPDVTVQLGARVTEFDRSPFDDPFWYGAAGPFHRPFFYGGYGGYGRFGRGFRGPYRGGFWGGGAGWDSSYFEREVAVLIRDKKTGQPLYETRASSDGTTADVVRLLPAMYGAAMKDFPRAVDNVSHRVPIDATARN